MLRRFIYPELWILVFFAAITRIWQLFSPNAVVFDEVYFKAFAGHYLDGHYFFDIHPPLGKLILAAWAHVWGLTGVQLASTPALPLRLVPAVFGIALIPIVWGIAHRLGASRRAAFLAGFLVLTDNALTVESRFILTDSILLATGLGAIYFYLVARAGRSAHRTLLLILSAGLAGASLSTKWTGLTALVLIIMLWLYDCRRTVFKQAWWRELVILILTPAILYLGLFFIHFQLLPLSGEGDAFMSSRFQSTLLGSPYYRSTAHMSFPAKFIELNVEMFRANQTLTASHPYGSHWYSWPAELRPIYYWQDPTLADAKQGNIYLLGNPVVWWGSFVAIIIGLMTLAIRRNITGRRIGVVAFLVTAYAINYLPFTLVSRVMFLYHYFFSLIFGIILAVVMWSWLVETSNDKSFRYAYYIAIGLAGASFLYFAPLTYGWPLSPQALQSHMWLNSWR